MCNNKMMRKSDCWVKLKQWPCCCLGRTNISSANTKGTPASQLYPHLPTVLCFIPVRRRQGRKGRKEGNERPKKKKEQQQSLVWVLFRDSGAFQGKCRLSLNRQTHKKKAMTLWQREGGGIKDRTAVVNHLLKFVLVWIPRLKVCRLTSNLHRTHVKSSSFPP